MFPNLSLFVLETPKGPKRKRIGTIFQEQLYKWACISNCNTMTILVEKGLQTDLYTVK